MLVSAQRTSSLFRQNIYRIYRIVPYQTGHSVSDYSVVDAGLDWTGLYCTCTSFLSLHDDYISLLDNPPAQLCRALLGGVSDTHSQNAATYCTYNMSNLISLWESLAHLHQQLAPTTSDTYSTYIYCTVVSVGGWNRRPMIGTSGHPSGIALACIFSTHWGCWGGWLFIHILYQHAVFFTSQILFHAVGSAAPLPFYKESHRGFVFGRCYWQPSQSSPIDRWCWERRDRTFQHISLIQDKKNGLQTPTRLRASMLSPRRRMQKGGPLQIWQVTGATWLCIQVALHVDPFPEVVCFFTAVCKKLYLQALLSFQIIARKSWLCYTA